MSVSEGIGNPVYDEDRPLEGVSSLMFYFVLCFLLHILFHLLFHVLIWAPLKQGF